MQNIFRPGGLAYYRQTLMRIEQTYRRPPSNTSAFNRFGTPALSVPCGFSRDRLPIGLQIVGPAFQEASVLAVAYTYQQATDWHTRRPSL